MEGSFSPFFGKCVLRKWRVLNGGTFLHNFKDVPIRVSRASQYVFQHVHAFGSVRLALCAFLPHTWWGDSFMGSVGWSLFGWLSIRGSKNEEENANTLARCMYAFVCAPVR